MQICICIPTFNQRAFVGRAVESCLAQTGVEIRVIVSDDASTDDTATVLKCFADDPRVVYHQQPKNRGIAANAGWVMAQADTEFFVRLDSDDLLAPNYCATLANALRQNPAAGVAHAAVREIDQHGAYRRMRRLRRSSGYQEPDVALRDAMSGYRVAANICMFRRSALKEVVPIYRLGMNFCEDWDLFVRLAAAGWGNVYSDDVLASYRVWTDAGGYRAGRKLTELAGTRQVFEDTLAPAFRARGWNEVPLQVARQRLACGQARALLIVPKSSPDYKAITQSLLNLGDCNGLRLRLTLIKCGAGGLLNVYAAIQVNVKDWVKAMLRKITGRSGRRT